MLYIIISIGNNKDLQEQRQIQDTIQQLNDLSKDQGIKVDE